ncbi:phenylacetyl-CoA ligase [Mycena belliarum]|uniref:Phenylacetyl-CoA ligase n=1 Tax=Mycena belliarum TaxID=1033014 RepID=A0AAD6XT63_9AGAR|nr:phenylacetyl-CoA ligase [Mycena belliae]
MTEFCSPFPLPSIPDDLTIPQFFLEGYTHPNSTVRKDPTDVWFIDDATGRQVTFGELRVRTDHLTLGLAASCDIKDGAVVLFFSPNHIDYVLAIWAFQRLGAIVATGNPMYTSEELVHLLRLSKATRIVTDARFLGPVHSALAATGLPSSAVILLDIAEMPAPSGIKTISELVSVGEQSQLAVPNQKLEPGGGKTKAALIFFSSGTSGKPKAVALSHYAVLANIIQLTAQHRDGTRPRALPQWAFLPGDVVTGLLPFFHVYGLIVNVYWTCFLGLILDVVPKFSLSTFLTSITKYRISHLILVPPHIVLMCKDPSVGSRDYGHVKSIFSGGASISVPLMTQATQLFPNASISQGYGMSEVIIAALPDPGDPEPDGGSCGKMLPGFVAKVLKADGSYGGPGEEGELVMTGPSVGMGYLGDQEGNKSTFVNGWVHSGDEVRFSEDGKLFIVDRLKELIKVRGFQVAPAELEDHLMAHPYVADVCVISILDDYSGELPLALVVPSAAAKTAIDDGKGSEIKAAIQKHVSDHKVKDKWLAGGVRFIEVVPKSPSGKLLRRILRDKVRSENGAVIA